MSIQPETMPKLGFGLMRLPEKDGQIDIEQVRTIMLNVPQAVHPAGTAHPDVP